MTDNQASDIPPMRYRGYTIIHLPSAEGKPPGKLDFAFYDTAKFGRWLAESQASKMDQIDFGRWLAGSQASAMDQIDELVGPY